MIKIKDILRGAAYVATAYVVNSEIKGYFQNKPIYKIGSLEKKESLLYNAGYKILALTIADIMGNLAFHWAGNVIDLTKSWTVPTVTITNSKQKDTPDSGCENNARKKEE